ncbi:hypothetical protein SBOR_2405 [Sclerotinia borealis F-4128]|uniref:BTB domain-containing protein n=1 Tax=Sclerotinia borealis (strain F-4128) TaxID=1432307 RepID=W9CMY2_SCLBF|nr:hypothetical protein SBOR_2405 [Sclerotinia borealis F-4128]
MAEQDTHASHFGGHPIRTEKITEKVSGWTVASLGKASTNNIPNSAPSEQDRFGSNSSIIPPWNTGVNATAVGLLQRSFLPALTTNSTLSLISYTIARLTNRFDLKDVFWPLGPLITSWTVALQRHNFDISQTWSNLGYPQKVVLAGLTAWSVRLFYHITSRAISRGQDDARYTSQQKTPDFWNKSLFSTFLPEALVQSIIALPFTMCLAAPEVLLGNQPLPGNPGYQIANAAGVFLFTTGFVLEAGADWQLESHKQDRTVGLLTEGIWSIVRHPNYLGDTLLHASFPLILYGAGLFHPLMLLAPLANYTFLRYIGGQGENEVEVKDSRKVKDLEKYKREKNSFWPGVDELHNEWTWTVVAIGAAGVFGEWGLRKCFLRGIDLAIYDYKHRDGDIQYEHGKEDSSYFSFSPFRQAQKVLVSKERKQRKEGKSGISLFHYKKHSKGFLKKRFMLIEERESEVQDQLLKEQFAEDSRIIREGIMSEAGGSSSGSDGKGSGLDAGLSEGVNANVQERDRDGGGSQSVVGGGYAGFASGGLGSGNGYGAGIGIGSGNFRGREPKLEENEVVLEGPLVALKAALLAGRFSDLTIFHGVRVWNAHKVVVCSQSAVLESMIDNTGVSDMFGNPTKPSILNLSSFPLDSITALMEYLYTSAYSIPSPTGNSSPSTSTYASGPSYSLPLHEQIFYLAVHLQIPALETLAAASFRHTLNTQISNLDVYFASITRIYGKTTESNPGLRNALVEAAVQELGGLLGDDRLRDTLWGAMGKNREFWEGVLRFLGTGRDVEVREVVREVRVPVEVEVEVESKRILCEQCGPCEKEEYVIACACRGCGEDKVIKLF